MAEQRERGGRRPRQRLHVAAVATATALATATAGLVAVNVVSGEHAATHPVAPLYAVADPQFARTADVLYGPPLAAGNRVTSLYNGREIFAAMLDDIRRARRTIDFETYIYWSGHVGAAFADALAERARAGVAVHLILDAVGSGKMDAAQLEAMRAAGVQIEKYHPIRWWTLDRINNRTHRKLLVVDGRVGFTGGVGIADKWDGDATDPDHWRDNHYRLEGPAVAQMQATFLEHWRATRGDLLHGDDYFPVLEDQGQASAQMIRSAVDDGSDAVRLMYLASIAASKSSVLIASAYFVPDDVAVRALVDARRRGVDVQIIVPGPVTDTKVTRAASRSRWGELLESGVAIYEFQPTMYHCKVMIVDDRWVSVGSTNFDNRSFHLNAEANLNVLDPEFAAAERRAFEADRRRSKRVAPQGWRGRPVMQRVGDWMAGLIGAQL